MSTGSALPVPGCFKIGGLPAWEYIDYIVDNVAGDILDHKFFHNARTNFAFSLLILPTINSLVTLLLETS